MSDLAPQPNEDTSELGRLFQRIRSEIHRWIVGQDHLVDRLLIALLADGHILLEGVPGLAKTKTLTALTSILDATMSRIQFTPDLLPSDILGTEVYRPSSGDFIIRKGPIFANILLADEINRAPAKVQSALLQAMQERSVTIGAETFRLPEPFLVLATQNPIEQEGTYPLPEAQVDRFLMKVTVGYPSFDEELAIVALPAFNGLEDPSLEKVISAKALLELRGKLGGIYVDPKIDTYIVSLVQGTRACEAFGLKGMVEWGASPRASIALKSASRARALLHGKSFVSPDDVRELAYDVLRHRIVLTFEADARGITPDEVIRIILKSVTVP